MDSTIILNWSLLFNRILAYETPNTIHAPVQSRAAQQQAWPVEFDRARSADDTDRSARDDQDEHPDRRRSRFDRATRVTERNPGHHAKNQGSHGTGGECVQVRGGDSDPEQARGPEEGEAHRQPGVPEVKDPEHWTIERAAKLPAALPNQQQRSRQQGQ